jgi:hypothetical protein
MNAEEAFWIVDTAVFAKTGKHLNDVQRAILLGSFERLTYERIADRSGYSPRYLLQDAGHELWKLLSDIFGERVSKSNYWSVIERRSLIKTGPSSKPEPEEELIFEQSSPSPSDWGTAPSAAPFYGRNEELERLKDWILLDGCRLLTVFGIAGTGKTFLSVKLAQQMVDDFEVVVWRSLSQSEFRTQPPSLRELCDDLIEALAHSLGKRIESFFGYLANYHCLIVLDGWEAVLRSGAHDGSYQTGYEDYAGFLQYAGRVAKIPSCVLITSQEQPKEAAEMEIEIRQVRSWELQGLEEDAGQNFFLGDRLSGSSSQLGRLIRRCSSNPRLLGRIATTIRNDFGGDIARFLEFVQKDTIWGINDLLNAQFNRLSEAEQAVIIVICQLTNNGEPATLMSILRYVTPLLSKSQLREAVLPSLLRRSLIEVNFERYCLRDLVMEYVMSKLIGGDL